MLGVVAEHPTERYAFEAQEDEPHDLQAVCAPLTSWNVPVPQPLQTALEEEEHAEERKVPAPHDARHDLQAVCVPAVS